MAKALGLEFNVLEPQPSNPIMKVLYTPVSGPVAFPWLQGIQDVALTIWAKAASRTASSRKLENLYRIREEGCDFLFRHPQANSRVSEVFPAKGRAGNHSSPLNKEGRRLDLLGRKIHSSGAMGLRVANFIMVMGHILNATMGENVTVSWVITGR